MWRSLMICTAVAIAGCATTPAAHQTAQSANNPCVPVTTASRLTQSNCPAAQSYTQQDINSTGKTDVADALRMLASNVSVGH